MVKNQPQAVTLANPFEIYLHRKERSKKIRVKDSVCIRAIRELFFDLRPVAAGSQDELQIEFRVKSVELFSLRCDNVLPQKHQTKHRKNTKQNTTKIPNNLQNQHTLQLMQFAVRHHLRERAAI